MTRCRLCHATAMRRYRKTHKPTQEQRAKHLARKKARNAKAAGKLVPKPCKCGSTQVEMHHEDYSKPLEVEWSCKKCHVDTHYPPATRKDVRIRNMKLGEWMERNFCSTAMFAEKVAKELGRDSFSVRTVEAWRQGRNIPRYRLFPVIAKITDNEVTGNDFVSRETNGAA